MNCFAVKSLGNLRRQPGRVLLISIALLVLTVKGVRAADAVAKIQEAVHIDSVGDAHFRVTVTMPAWKYTRIKQNTPNVAAWMRQLGYGQGWAKIEQGTGRFDDLHSRVVFEYTERGLARSLGRNRWSVPAAENANLELVAQFENSATFATTVSNDVGVSNLVVQVVLPEGCEDVRFAANPQRLEYSLDSPPPQGEAVSTEFDLAARPQLMACLAKCYGNPQFNLLWVARSTLRNTGQQPIDDYRVRFRLIGYSEWSAWKRSRRVLPGQTVVDPFFPFLDLSRLAELNSAVTTAVEVEYQYTRPDGQTMRESDRRRIRLLARNQIIFSSLDPTEQVTWFDAFNYGPLVLSSFVTGNDPVIQQLAGIVSGRAGGVAATRSDAEAYEFLKALYAFLCENGISYQTPPGGSFQGQMGQHVKHGRDVLHNRAGTCVDLAILHASVCQAVGLDPILVLVDGHCFPAVKMPEGGYLAVEATCIGDRTFDEAVQIGAQKLQEFQQTGLGYLIDIQSLHEQGVDTLDLPRVPTDFLKSLGYHTSTVAATRADVEAVSGESQQSQPAAENVCYAVLRIANPLNGPVYYQMKVGDGEWVKQTVEAGEIALHGAKIPVEAAADLPTVFIRFDYDLSNELAWRTYKLEWSVLDIVDERTIQTARTYKFSLVDQGQGLQLFGVND